MKHLGLCKACKMEENLAIERIEDSAYMKMLETARGEEIKKRKQELYASNKETANIPMVHQSVQLMQERDMRYLIDTVWGAQSAISAKAGIHDLVLTRWNVRKELSPWNCIVLTKSEAMVHDLSADPETNYAPDFVKKIKQKHIAAHAHFSQLPDMQSYVKEAFYEEKRTGKILHRRLLAVATK